MRVTSLLSSLTVGVTTLAFAAGCSSNQSSMPQPMHQTVPMAITTIPLDGAVQPDAATGTVGIRLTGETPGSNPKYGAVQGYFKGKKSTTAQVVTLAANTNVVFQSEDTTLPHTGSFLGDASKKSAPWPKTFTGSETASPAGTAIGTTGFSTGVLTPGKKSAIYSTGAPGFYMFGCYFHYVPDQMRTVIIVK
jgi:hypothetical protein